MYCTCKGKVVVQIKSWHIVDFSSDIFPACAVVYCKVPDIIVHVISTWLHLLGIVC